ncbi:hypothetical protein OS493_007322 [Desmophyllum pertusum]|uniref:Uncharacterized protein n=1 Tax=Desmophyllum pertusum TaxID=174260 RepID=A0A9W9Z5M8_9CNID|nr:hypothetical protein OS493_007322 [Desmophyllum pertusum]
MPAYTSTQPEIFTSPPEKSSSVEKKPGQLTDEQVKQYFDEGFLLIPDFFERSELEPVITAICELVDQLAQKLYNAGKINDKYEDATFYKRLSLIEKDFPGAAVLLHKRGVMPKAFQDLWTNERLLNVMEQFIGPDIAGHPVWNLRTKTPKNSQVTVPWHQDCAYLSSAACEILQPTAWIPLIDANRINGCMQVARGGHRKGILATHTCCAGGTWYVDLAEEEMKKTLDVDFEKDIALCEVPFGGVLFINNLVPHRSLENFSDKIRWSMDLRWQNPDKPNGFYGLKENILLRTSTDPNYTVDWAEFASRDRAKLQKAHVDVQAKLEKEDIKLDKDPEFDTTIVGPWMGNWEIVHHNKHTAQYKDPGDDSESWTNYHSTWTKA